MLVTPKSHLTFFEALDWLHDQGIYYPEIVLLGHCFMYDLDPWNQNLKGFDSIFDRSNVVIARKRLLLAA